jgi:hypothetical protein
MSTVTLTISVDDFAPELREDVQSYLNQLSDIEKIACNIAKDHLGSSFNLTESNGFLEWKKSCEK